MSTVDQSPLSPLSILSLDKHYETVIDRCQQIVDNLRGSSSSNANLAAQFKSFESGWKSLDDRVSLPDMRGWAQRLKLAPQPKVLSHQDPRTSYQGMPGGLGCLARQLDETLSRYEDEVNHRFTKTFTEVLSRCIDSTYTADTLHDIYETCQQKSLRYSRNEFLGLKKELSEADTSYRRLEEINNGTLCGRSPTPTGPCTLTLTPDLKVMWEKWKVLQDRVSKVREAKSALEEVDPMTQTR